MTAAPQKYTSLKLDDSRSSQDNTPDKWLKAAKSVGHGIYYTFEDGDTHPRIWFWSTRIGRWVGAGTDKHDLISKDPLHLEPSLLIDDGDHQLHGWIRNGEWTPA